MQLAPALPADPDPPRSAPGGSQVVVGLILGYIGVYLCRKNLAVAVPLLQQDLHVSKTMVGWITTASTAAYLLGKLAGPAIDRIGGRAGFLLALAGVTVFGALGGLAPGIFALCVFYSLNRLFGSLGWGAMMKLVPTWFSPRRLGTVVAILSLSYVLGGSLATLLARRVVTSGGSWRLVMAFPSIVALLLLALCVVLVRSGPLSAPSRRTPTSTGGLILRLLRQPRFLLVCALSFTLTLLRETFNTWSVDFLTTIETGSSAVADASLKSIWFDLAGGVSILLMGYLYDRVPQRGRRWLIAGILLCLALVLWSLPAWTQAYPQRGGWLIGLVGLLVYGPYSLLGGVMAVETGKEQLAATAAGLIDAVGYFAGALSGVLLGRILDLGGYGLGFHCLAGVTLLAALLSLGLRADGGGG